jgi:hypothetical protein
LTGTLTSGDGQPIADFLVRRGVCQLFVIEGIFYLEGRCEGVCRGNNGGLPFPGASVGLSGTNC